MTISKYLLEIIILLQELKIDVKNNCKNIEILQKLDQLDQKIPKFIMISKKFLNINKEV
jgi:hypothetical protein